MQNHGPQASPDAPYESLEEVLRTRLLVIQRLGRLAEYKEDPGGRHVIRVSQYARALGLRAGMAPAEAEILMHAATMHDVGKIGIPEHILTKPGRLDDDEWEVMKTHAALGAEIIGSDDSPVLRMARDVALTHHEKWNGEGYPRGLAGEAIPLPGRIVAIADVFDALTSARPYKPAWPMEKAVALIRHESGTLFEPRLVALFVDALEDLLSVRAQYAETGVPGAPDAGA